MMSNIFSSFVTTPIAGILTHDIFSQDEHATSQTFTSTKFQLFPAGIVFYHQIVKDLGIHLCCSMPQA
jgi:hypothetical protein